MGLKLLSILIILAILEVVIEAACKDKVKTCNRVSGLCNDAKVGSTIRRNCEMTCGQCKAAKKSCMDNPRCYAWVKNGYCGSNLYTRQQKLDMCPKACGRDDCKKTGGGTKKPNNRKPTKKPNNEAKYRPFANSMNETARPCNDFYQFVCGRYMQRNPPKGPNDNFATFNDLNDNVIKQQTALLFGNDSTTSAAVKKMRDFRDKCMNVAEVEKARTDQLRADLVTISKCPIIDPTWVATSYNLTKTLTEMVKLSGEHFLFDIEANRMPDDNAMAALFSPADLIIKKLDAYTDPKMADKLTALKDFLTNIMGLVATDAKSTKTFAQIETAITEVMSMEKKIAKILSDNGYQDPDPTKQPVVAKKKFNDLGTVVTAVNWANYIKDDTRLSPEVKTYLGTNPDVRLYTEKMLKELDAFYTAASTNKETLTNYLCVQFVIKQIPYLDSRFSGSGNQFAEKIDGSKHKSTRDQDCYDSITTNFPLVSDHLYVNKYLTDRTVKAMSSMIEDLRTGLAEVFRGEKWMSKATKDNAEKKIKKTTKIIGAVDDVKDVAKLDKRYDGIKFVAGDTYPKMAIKVKEYIAQQALMKLVNKKFDTQSEEMRATDVNAMHIYEENLIYMSAAILQPPFFDLKQPAAVQYGAIGFIVGHEFTHGFDSGGADYDETGAKKDWWDPSTKKEFKNRSQCFINLYGKQKEPTTNKNVDGNLTIPENIADNGGIRSAFKAYKKHLKGRKERYVSGYAKYTNDQTFFISYGTSFCSSMSKEQADMRLKTDTHSPTRFRVNVVLSNLPEFAKAFSCPKGSRMNPKDQCSVW